MITALAVSFVVLFFITQKGDEIMRTIQSELQDKGYVVPNKNVQQVPKKKITENLTDKEWKELMGCNRDIFTKRNGAYRRK